MKKLLTRSLALLAVLAVALFGLAACGPNEETPEGVDGTYTCTVVNDLGDNEFTLILSNGSEAQMNIAAGPINDAYFGTYVADGDNVAITGLNNPNNPNSTTPGLWNDIIDAETGDCDVVLDRENNTFTFVPTGNSALPELPEGDNVYTYEHTGDIGTDTFTLTLGDDNVATMQISNAVFTDTYTGTYTISGNDVSIKGLTGETMMGTGAPGLFPTLIDTTTGDCEVTLNPADNTFTFKPTGAEVGGDDEWTGGETYEGVAYVEDGTSDQTMNIYVPQSQEALPLMVTIHGGGFKFGSATMDMVMTNVYGYFRDNGYVCASLNYTMGVGTYPQAIIDCKTAVQYLVDNAETYNIDATNITVMGESAGAYLAIMTSLTGADDFLGDRTESYTFDVTNLIDFYGPIYADTDTGIEEFVGNTTTQAANPETYLVSGNTDLNIWIQHGTGDTSVNYQQHSEKFAAALEEAGYDVEYSTIEGAGHMDASFYTDENLGKVFAWLGGEVAEVVGTYSCTITSTNPITGEDVTDVFELVLYSDGTCTIAIPDGNDMVKGPYSGTYTLDGDTITVNGLSVPPIGYTFVSEGSFAATLNSADGTFTPVTE